MTVNSLVGNVEAPSAGQPVERLPGRRPGEFGPRSFIIQQVRDYAELPWRFCDFSPRHFQQPLGLQAATLTSERFDRWHSFQVADTNALSFWESTLNPAGRGSSMLRFSSAICCAKRDPDFAGCSVQKFWKF